MSTQIIDSPEISRDELERIYDSPAYGSSAPKPPLTRPEQFIRVPSPEEQIELAERAKIETIHGVTRSVAAIYDTRLRNKLSAYYEKLNSQPLFVKLPRMIYNDILRPPKLERAPYTKYDVTKTAGEIGGKLLEGGNSPDFIQNFFLSLENDGEGRVVSEWVLNRSRPSAQSRGAETVAHFHFLVGQDQQGRPEIFKYFGSDITNREKSHYVIVRGQELDNLAQAVTLFERTLRDEWGIAAVS
jgi:hypothetical protein